MFADIADREVFEAPIAPCHLTHVYVLHMAMIRAR